MKELIEKFSNQIIDAIAIGKKIKLSKPTNTINNIVVSGLGGSGIGANLVQEFLASSLTIPFIVNKDYNLPKFVNKHSLVIISSYSGNTEETVQSLKEAMQVGAKIVCITSGGQIAETAKAKKLDLILIPGGMPPRSCLAYSALQQLYVLNQLGFIKNTFESQLKKAVTLLDEQETSIIKEAKNIAKKIFDKTPIIYSIAGNEAVAVRFRQQVNENGKQLCWHHVIPEMNHNELVGWRTKDKNLAVIIFKTKVDNPRSLKRAELNAQIFKKYTNTIIVINAIGDTFFERAMYQIHLGDWVSYYLSQYRKFDCTEVKVIDWLKGELQKV